ncbi:MAG TPA: hypothetical protein VLA82_05605 [Actinomycetota bacterium]|nr:hypothetical protein [Actinomycetota bacterium]
MSTKAGTMGFPSRPALFTLWSVTVSVLAAAALILSALALQTASRGDGSLPGVDGSGARAAVRTGSPLWDVGKLQAMEARMLAEAARIQGSSPLWDADKLHAMEARMLAEAARAQGTSQLWDPGKLEAMEARMNAEAIRAAATEAP